MSAGTAPPASLHALGTGIQSLAQQLGCLSMHGAGESLPQILELGLAAAAAAAPQGSGRAGLWEDRRVAEELGRAAPGPQLCHGSLWLCSPGAVMFLWKGHLQRVSQPAERLGTGRGFTVPCGEESGFHGNVLFGCLC